MVVDFQQADAAAIAGGDAQTVSVGVHPSYAAHVQRQLERNVPEDALRAGRGGASPQGTGHSEG